MTVIFITVSISALSSSMTVCTPIMQTWCSHFRQEPSEHKSQSNSVRITGRVYTVLGMDIVDIAIFVYLHLNYDRALAKIEGIWSKMNRFSDSDTSVVA